MLRHFGLQCNSKGLTTEVTCTVLYNYSFKCTKNTFHKEVLNIQEWTTDSQISCNVISIIYVKVFAWEQQKYTMQSDATEQNNKNDLIKSIFP